MVDLVILGFLEINLIGAKLENTFKADKRSSRRIVLRKQFSRSYLFLEKFKDTHF